MDEEGKREKLNIFDSKQNFFKPVWEIDFIKGKDPKLGFERGMTLTKEA